MFFLLHSPRGPGRGFLLPLQSTTTLLLPFTVITDLPPLILRDRFQVMSADLPRSIRHPSSPGGSPQGPLLIYHWLSFFQSHSSQAWSLNFTSEITGIYPLSFTATITPVRQRISPPNRKTPSTRLPVLMSLHLSVHVPEPLAALPPSSSSNITNSSHRPEDALSFQPQDCGSGSHVELPMPLYNQSTLPEHSEPPSTKHPATCLSLQTSQRQRTCLWDPMFVLWNDVRACLGRHFAVTDISLC